MLSLLIDDGVPSSGHTKNILNKEYCIIGVGFDTHLNTTIHVLSIMQESIRS